MAKREMVEGIDRRIEKYAEKLKHAEDNQNVESHIHAKSAIEALENIRNFVRNVMLWDTTNDISNDTATGSKQD